MRIALQDSCTHSQNEVSLSDAVPPVLQNPFGAAKPREAILATRVGKKEEDILKEEVLKEKLAVSPP